MKQVCVLGNGQLGRMLRQAGEPLGIAVWPVGLDAEPEAVPFHQSVITAEIERWPETALTRELARHNAFVNRDVFPIIADRLTQKQLFDKLGLATAPWQLLSDKREWDDVFAMLGDLAIVKRRVGGYDGRGQWRLRANDTAELPDDCYGECIVEQGINFSGEVSLVGARGHDGHTVFYPLTHNLHQDGILRTSVAFPHANADQQTQAEEMLSAIMHELGYVGVMAMECFRHAVGSADQRTCAARAQQRPLDAKRRLHQPVRAAPARHHRSAAAAAGGDQPLGDDQPDRHRSELQLAEATAGAPALVRQRGASGT